MKTFREFKTGDKLYFYNRNIKKMIIFDAEVEEKSSFFGRKMISFYDDIGERSSIILPDESLDKTSVEDSGIIFSTAPIQ